MKLSITIDCNNLAFSDGNRIPEIVRILTKFTKDLTSYGSIRMPGELPSGERFMHDKYGNTVGSVIFTSDESDN